MYIQADPFSSVNESKFLFYVLVFSWVLIPASRFVSIRYKVFDELSTYINSECFEEQRTSGHGWEGFQEKGEEFIPIKRQNVNSANCCKKSEVEKTALSSRFSVKI